MSVRYTSYRLEEKREKEKEGDEEGAAPSIQIKRTQPGGVLIAKRKLARGERERERKREK